MSKIAYPRKCNHCNYLSNNPSMYHYHAKTHDAIPTGTLCDHGCGLLAQYKKTKGGYSCQQITQRCPGYIKQHSVRVKQQWVGDTARKEKTKESFVSRLHNQETVNRIKATKRKKSGLLTPELAKDYRHYARAVRKKAQHWAKEQGYVLGQQTYHVDHKFSILDAWHANLAETVVNHPSNLQIIDAKINSGKGSRSSITLEELLYNVTQAAEQA